MRRIGWLLCTFIFFSASSVALERGTIANTAQAVTPLLNGQKIPDTKIYLADGTPVSLRALVMQKPTIILFYRGGWCPYCTRQLADLATIEKPLMDAGYQILAISPQSITQLTEQKLDTEFAVTLLSDEQLDTIRGFGIAFYLDDETEVKYRDYGISLTKDGSGRSVLPAPAVFIADKSGVIHFSYVNPDYRVRPSSQLLLAVAEALTQP